MPCCKKSINLLLCSILLLWLYAAGAHAEGLTVNKAEVRLSEDGYQLVASYDIHLTYEVQQALERGIPLYFENEFLLTKSRWYWMDEVIYKGEQTTKLSYNVLARQYRISRGALFQNFVDFEAAMNMLSRQSSAPIPVELIKPDTGYIAGILKGDGNYVAAMRLRLDTSQLPKLLQVNALTENHWSLNSDWYRWVIKPKELAVPNSGVTQ